MVESGFQSKLIEELEHWFPGCIILKNDAGYIQGIPDLLILYKNKWAMLEVKKNAHATQQPNQEYYVDILNQMSYAAFIYPENKDEVIYEIQQSFGI